MHSGSDDSPVPLHHPLHLSPNKPLQLLLSPEDGQVLTTGEGAEVAMPAKLQPGRQAGSHKLTLWRVWHGVGGGAAVGRLFCFECFAGCNRIVYGLRVFT